jgi:hypothetical protein
VGMGKDCRTPGAVAEEGCDRCGYWYATPTPATSATGAGRTPSGRSASAVGAGRRTPRHPGRPAGRAAVAQPVAALRQTLLPLAAALDLDLEAVEDLGIDGDVDHLVELLGAPGSDGAVLCTHGEVLGELLARLRTRGAIHRGNLPTEGRLRYEKGSTWVLEEAVDGRFRARCLPPPAPRTEHRWWWQGSVRAELGRLALEQQWLLGTIAALTTTTQQLAAELGPRLAALTAEGAALSQLDQVRESARALADRHAQLVETQRRVLGGLLPGTQPPSPARMVAGLTDAGAILTTASSDRGRRHSTRRWAVLAEQPLAVRAEPAQVERLMLALLDAADAALPPAAPAWVICPSHRRRGGGRDRHRSRQLAAERAAGDRSRSSSAAAVGRPGQRHPGWSGGAAGRAAGRGADDRHRRGGSGEAAAAAVPAGGAAGRGVAGPVPFPCLRHALRGQLQLSVAVGQRPARPGRQGALSPRAGPAVAGAEGLAVVPAWPVTGRRLDGALWSLRHGGP